MTTTDYPAGIVVNGAVLCGKVLKKRYLSWLKSYTGVEYGYGDSKSEGFFEEEC